MNKKAEILYDALEEALHKTKKIVTKYGNAGCRPKDLKVYEELPGSKAKAWTQEEWDKVKGLLVLFSAPDEEFISGLDFSGSWAANYGKLFEAEYMGIMLPGMREKLEDKIDKQFVKFVEHYNELLVQRVFSSGADTISYDQLSNVVLPALQSSILQGRVDEIEETIIFTFVNRALIQLLADFGMETLSEEDIANTIFKMDEFPQIVPSIINIEARGRKEDRSSVIKELDNLSDVELFEATSGALIHGVLSVQMNAILSAGFAVWEKHAEELFKGIDVEKATQEDINKLIESINEEEIGETIMDLAFDDIVDKTGFSEEQINGSMKETLDKAKEALKSVIGLHATLNPTEDWEARKEELGKVVKQLLK